ncbi:hypothetical protein Trydic_g3450 [Trypoxylus dichotomus]
MVLSVLLRNSWILPGVSAGVLICIVMILVLCTCMKRKNNESLCGLRIFNRTIESSENLKDVEYGVFRKFSVLSANNLKVFTNKLKPCKNSNCTNRERSVSENELLDPLDDSSSFEYAVLRVDDADTDVCQFDTAFDDSDEALSCLSNESKFTAYSTFTLTRTSSFADTMKNGRSDTDVCTYAGLV